MDNLEEIIAGSRFTIFLGKNGAGKSSRLRVLDSTKNLQTKYITPERGGTLRYDPNIEHQVIGNRQSGQESWISRSRRQNQGSEFRQQSAYQFRRLELAFLRDLEKNESKRADTSYDFDNIVQKINSLLDNVRIKRGIEDFTVENLLGEEVNSSNISSGESELIALAIETLVFSIEERGNRFLLLDEPDVHLHPDLQQRFVNFLEKEANEGLFSVVIATHSTAMVGAFSDQSKLVIVPITSRSQTAFTPFERSEVTRQIIPIFGTSPLSNQFNLMAPILVEGEDDKRVIEQLTRSRQDEHYLMPCVAGNVDQFYQWEKWMAETLPAIYDTPSAFSLRDLDTNDSTELDPVGCVIRARLNCYSIENLLLSTDCLQQHGFDEESFKAALTRWASINEHHQYVAEAQRLIDQFSSRRTTKIKETRNIVTATLGSNKPWEVVVGRILAGIENWSNDLNSATNYIGTSAANILLPGIVTET